MFFAGVEPVGGADLLAREVVRARDVGLTASTMMLLAGLVVRAGEETTSLRSSLIV